MGPLLPLLKNGVKRSWTEEMQAVFEAMREKFAHSIQLIHPDENLPYCAYTDACRYGISGILM
jgi:hypothetical protein